MRSQIDDPTFRTASELLVEKNPSDLPRHCPSNTPGGTRLGTPKIETDVRRAPQGLSSSQKSGPRGAFSAGLLPSSGIAMGTRVLEAEFIAVTLEQSACHTERGLRDGRKGRCGAHASFSGYGDAANGRQPPAHRRAAGGSDRGASLPSCAARPDVRSWAYSRWASDRADVPRILLPTAHSGYPRMSQLRASVLRQAQHSRHLSSAAAR